MRFRIVALITCVLSLTTIGMAAPEAPSTVLSDVQYCSGGGSPLLMDIFIPNQRIVAPTPAILWIHGGGWAQGDKNGNSGAKFLANGGFVTASLTYRLSGDSPFPAQIEDCKCAIRFLRANAKKYGIDPGRIGVAGSSAGGHLAELVATTRESPGFEGDGGWRTVSSRVEAAAAYYGVSDMTVSAAEFPHDTDQLIVKLLRSTEKESPKLYRKASPMFYVSRNSPPLLLAHGRQDDVVPFDQSVRMAQAYRRAGLPVEFIEVENAGHNFDPMGNGPITPSVDVIHQKTIDFFKQYLILPGAISKH